MFVFQYSEKIWRLPRENPESLSVVSVDEMEAHDVIDSEDSLRQETKGDDDGDDDAVVVVVAETTPSWTTDIRFGNAACWW